MEFLLVLEDNEEAKAITHYFCEHCPDLEYMHTANDKEALEFLSFAVTDQLPKLVIIDMNGKFNGLDLVSKIRGDRKTGLIPIVLLANSHNEKDIIESHRLSVNAYILKPVNAMKFKRILAIAGFKE